MHVDHIALSNNFDHRTAIRGPVVRIRQPESLERPLLVIYRFDDAAIHPDRTRRTRGAMWVATGEER